MSFCLSTKYFCQVPVLITQRGSINWLSSICLLVGVDCGFTGVGSMQYRTPGRTQNPRWGILRGRWHIEMICGISGQNSSHLTSNVSLSTSTPDPIIWTAFVLNSKKLLRAQLFSFKCSYVTFSLTVLLWHQLCSSCSYLAYWDTQWRWGAVLTFSHEEI